MWLDFYLKDSLVLLTLLIWNHYLHIGDQELIPLVHPLEISIDESIRCMAEVLAKCEVIGTKHLAFCCNLFSQLWDRDIAVWSSMDSKRSSRTQNAFAELPAGKGEQHVSSCQAQLLASEVIHRVGAACSGWLHCITTHEVAPSIGQWDCCNPNIMCPWVCAAVLLLLIMHNRNIMASEFSSFEPTKFFCVKLHSAQVKLNEYIWRKTALFGWGKVFSKQQLLSLFACFSPPPGINRSVFSLFAKWNMLLLSVGTSFSLFRLSAQNQFSFAFSSQKRCWDSLTYNILVSVKHCLSLDFRRRLPHILWHTLGLSSAFWNGVTGGVSGASLIKEALGCAVTHG